MIRLTLLLALAISACASPQEKPSQPPAPGLGEREGYPPNQQTEGSDQTTGHQKERPAFPVEIRQTKEQAEQDKKQREQEAATNRWIILLTGLLVLVGAGTGFVVGWQALETRKAANAAKDSAAAAKDALYLLEGASVQLQEAHLDLPENPSSPIETMWNSTVTIKWRNYGRSIALSFIDDVDVTFNGTRKPGETRSATELVIAPTQTLARTTPILGTLLTPDEVRAVSDDRARLGFEGTASYKDAFGRTTTIEVAAEWAHGTQRFRWTRYSSIQTDPRNKNQRQSQNN